MFSMIGYMLSKFRKETSGLALTEYLILLGLLTALVIGAVLLFGGELGANWQTWGEWMRDSDIDAPAVVGAPTTGG